MHCRSCEILVGEKLKEDPNIKNIQVSFKDKEARVYSQHPLDMGKTRRLIAEAGYEVGVDESKSWLSMDTKNYLDLAKSLVVLLILYFIAKKIGLFNINTGTADKPSNLLFVLLIGQCQFPREPAKGVALPELFPNIGRDSVERIIFAGIRVQQGGFLVHAAPNDMGGVAKSPGVVDLDRGFRHKRVRCSEGRHRGHYAIIWRHGE